MFPEYLIKIALIGMKYSTNISGFLVRFVVVGILFSSVLQLSYLSSVSFSSLRDSIEKETSAILLFVSFDDFKRVQEISVLVSLSKEYFFFHFLISVFRTAAS